MTEDEKRRSMEYDSGRAWNEVYRARYFVIQKRVLCSFTVTPYRGFSYDFETSEEEPVECRDPLADYRHTGPLPRIKS